MTRLNPGSFSALSEILQSSLLVQVVMSIFTLLKVSLNTSVCNIAVYSADMPLLALVAGEMLYCWHHRSQQRDREKKKHNSERKGIVTMVF